MKLDSAKLYAEYRVILQEVAIESLLRDERAIARMIAFLRDHPDVHILSDKRDVVISMLEAAKASS